MEYKITIQDVTEQNKAEKLRKTVDRLSKAFQIPITIKQSIGKREEYAYQAQRDLYDRWTLHFARVADGLYLGLCRIFDLPVTKAFSKSLDTLQKAVDEERPLSIRGQIIYNPESRRPIKRKDWESLLSAIEKFLNRRLRGTEKKIVLENRALGRIINRLLKYNTWDAIKDVPLDEIKYKGRTFSYISDSFENLKNTFDTSFETGQVPLMWDHLGNHITEMNNEVKTSVKSTFVRGALQGKSKGEVSQDLFDYFGSFNKDWSRIYEYESVDNFNNAFLLEERVNADPGEKLYYERFEIADAHTCNFCVSIKGKIVLFVDHPLPDERITDPHTDTAIWPGKTNIGKKGQRNWWIAAGAQHPYCRGSWNRAFPGEESGVDVEARMKEILGEGQ